MFGSSIFRVALKIPNPNPVKWQQKAGGLLREEIRKGLYMNVEPKNEIEKNRANVDILLNFINKICQTFNLQIQNIGVSLQDMMKLAEKYQAIEAIEFSESASELVTFGTMLDE
ncbi:hypothetical protein GPJ56_000758 [Histomonas meleagridis]|uniref:uncharacterized protein n=1 Tax=Histomonas meleagridis TaxID=135588 RepID=UPI003559433F|nr:hypothetical protein GPJ56_000758 [Histomonas meleagridis]KAH0804483.1 hypothetical protein GO595_003313 [Histomonas meleagridis]